MQLEQLNFHHLFYFWRVAKTGHLTRAAQDMHVSQSALSAQIRQLEERLGEPLFERQGRRLVLTATGQMVLSYAENIFGLGQEMLGRLQGRVEGMTRLRVGSVATLSRNYQQQWIRPLLADPGVVLTLESGPLEHLLHRLAQHQLDVVLANEAVPADPDRPLHCRFLGSQAISLVGPASLWAGQRLRMPDDLHGLDIALPGPRHTSRAPDPGAAGGGARRVGIRCAGRALPGAAPERGLLCRHPEPALSQSARARVGDFGARRPGHTSPCLRPRSPVADRTEAHPRRWTVRKLPTPFAVPRSEGRSAMKPAGPAAVAAPSPSTAPALASPASAARQPEPAIAGVVEPADSPTIRD